MASLRLGSWELLSYKINCRDVKHNIHVFATYDCMYFFLLLLLFCMHYDISVSVLWPTFVFGEVKAFPGFIQCTVSNIRQKKNLLYLCMSTNRSLTIRHQVSHDMSYWRIVFDNTRNIEIWKSLNIDHQFQNKSLKFEVCVSLRNVILIRNIEHLAFITYSWTD